jgi:hypothetical protein
MLIYGNPTYKVVTSLKNSIIVREWNRLGVFDVLKNVPYPDEEMTKAELLYMVDLQKNVDSSRMERIHLYDDTLYEAMRDFLGSYGVITTAEEIKQQLDPYEPIVDYLKVMYNRPRPFQTAGMYGIALYPLLERVCGDGASSYPSGHTLLALLFRHFYMKRHPELSKELMRFAMDVKKSREEGGVHYPSDGVFSMKVYQHLAPWIDARTTIYSQGLDKLNGY